MAAVVTRTERLQNVSALLVASNTIALVARAKVASIVSYFGRRWFNYVSWQLNAHCRQLRTANETRLALESELHLFASTYVIATIGSSCSGVARFDFARFVTA